MKNVVNILWRTKSKDQMNFVRLSWNFTKKQICFINKLYIREIKKELKKNKEFKRNRNNYYKNKE